MFSWKRLITNKLSSPHTRVTDASVSGSVSAWEDLDIKYEGILILVTENTASDMVLPGPAP